MERSRVTIIERTHEEATEALHAGREGCHPREAFAGAGAESREISVCGLAMEVKSKSESQARRNQESPLSQKARKDGPPALSWKDGPPRQIVFYLA
jgi:hypothetical protein